MQGGRGVIDAYRPSDAHAWVALLNIVRRNPLGVEAFLEREGSRSPQDVQSRLVLRLGDTVVAIGQLSSSPYVAKEFLRLDLIVDERHRKIGLGGKLLSALERQVVANGFLGIYCEQDHGNEEAVGWLRRRGFEVAVRRRESCLDLEEPNRPPPTMPPVGISLVDFSGSGLDWELLFQFLQNRLSETPDLQDMPPWTIDRIDEIFRRSANVRPDWIILALCEGDPVGVGVMHQHASDAYLYFVGVTPAFRGRNIGQALMQELIRKASLAGCRRVSIDNREDNAAALRINDKLGLSARTVRLELRKWI
ncbi:GNAT family N-acetyltransferase [Rhizobium sp. G21]|uniref:GNAT family N-acetyltransferase n=1 Tax=Rhizobium sp. G21 TaxID=2758439 RepID=UPI0015FFFFD5|nr:GNAT family N-acetyltransferase [Rhizobium sp. G21]MBB1250967.1 GNAT family N-acetyltransferase [Rhizobium sp. G21]